MIRQNKVCRNTWSDAERNVYVLMIRQNKVCRNTWSDAERNVYVLIRRQIRCVGTALSGGVSKEGFKFIRQNKVCRNWIRELWESRLVSIYTTK